MEDIIIQELIGTGMWQLQRETQFDRIKTYVGRFTIHSHMKGFTDGRYRIEITKLGRKVEGKLYKTAIYWTPYNPNNCVFKGRFNTYEELVEIIGSVNKDLLDINRKY